jgi:uncharacterized metal-binding protein YceD (DUF177 family)
MAALPGVTHALDDLKLRLSQVGGPGKRFDFQPDEAARKAMAKTLDLVALPEFSAKVSASPWLDGAEISGAWSGRVVQLCGLSLEEFETPVKGVFTVRVLPPGSPNAPEMDSEVDVDPDADDPPDILEDDVLDLGGYVIEHLGLELDPFPRKPGAVFEAPDNGGIISPFAALRDLKP